MAINDFFVWGKGGAKLTPDQIAKQQELAQSLYKHGADFSPAGHWSVALGRGLSGLAGGFLDRSADRAQSEGIAGATDAFNNAGIAELLMGGASAPQSYEPQESSSPLQLSDRSIPQSALLADPNSTPALSAYLTPDKDKSHLNFDGDFASRMESFLAAAPGGGISIYSGYRSPERQVQLWDAALKKYGSPEAARKWVAPPGRSNHNHGMAADLRYASDAQKKWAHENAAKYGLYFRMGNEPWHIEPIKDWKGMSTQVASADPNFMPQASSEVTMSPVAQALTQPSPAAAAPIQQQATTAQAHQTNPVSEALLAQNDMALGGSLSPSQAVQPRRSAPNLQGLIQLANNPFLNDAQRGMVNTALQYQMQQNDPVRALQMQQIQQGLRKGDLEIAAMQNPAKKPIEVGGVLLDPDTYQPIYDSRQKADGGFTLSEGQQRFDASGNTIASVAPKVDPDQYETQRIKMPDGSEVMVERRKGTNDPWQASQIPQGGTTGTGASIRLTEGQSKDTVYSTRAAGALPVIDSLGEYLTNPFERAKEYDPTGLIRGTQSPEYQQAKNAGDEFLQAILRKDTGAAIAKEEMSSYGSVYLPMPGDSKEVLEQKREARSRALNAMQAGMPPEAILAQERALKKTNDKTGKSKPISEMTDAELEAIANGN